MDHEFHCAQSVSCCGNVMLVRVETHPCRISAGIVNEEGSTGDQQPERAQPIRLKRSVPER
jgi:hypothetical protein